MHTNKTLVPALLLMMLGFLFSSCENDVDINADYEEVTVVYGLLNQADDRQYIKITKAFQTDGDVFVAAKDPKNSMYDPKDLEVWLDEYSNGSFRKTIYLDSVLINNKDTGDFYSPYEIVYATPKGEKLRQKYEYRLSIKVKSSGKIIEAKTTLVHDFDINRPLAIQKYASFSGNYNQKVDWDVAENGTLYQLVIRFFYTENPQSGPSTSHYVDMVFPTKRHNKNDSKPNMTIEFSGTAFYQNLEAKMTLPEAGMTRYSDSLYYIFAVADEDFTVYMDINGPSNSVVQERPAYSNISGGVGLFSSRYTKIRYFAGLSVLSQEELIKGQYTNKLGFVDRP